MLPAIAEGQTLQRSTPINETIQTQDKLGTWHGMPYYEVCRHDWAHQIQWREKREGRPEREVSRWFD